MTRKAAAALLLLPAAACMSTPPPAAPQPVFSPLAFFSGRTLGNGVLRIAFAHARHVRVVGDGRVDPDGTLVLDQRIEESGKAPRTRTWRLRAAGGGRFAGTLSDASGPVDADARGNRLHIRFAATGGLRIEQWILLQPGGQSALNRLEVRKLGIRVALLDETIRRLP